MTQRPSARLLVWIGLLLVPLAGCQKDEVQTYTVPHEVEARSAPTARVRLLAAIVPAGNGAWFFKLVAREDIVKVTEDTFQTLVRSVTFADGEPSIRWKVPAGWKSQDGPPPRFATLRPEGVAGVEITISKLGNGEVKPNVDRWRRLDLGLGPVDDNDLGKYTKTIQVDGRDITLVDMTGPGVRKKGRGAMMGKGAPPGPLPLTYKAPAGWEETGPYVKQGIRVLTSFQVAEGGRRAEVTVLPLGGPTGSEIENVNRWRGQVGLGPITGEQFARDRPRKVEVAGLTGIYADLTGPRQRMLLVVLEKGKQKWYFKMLGDAELVGRHKGAFEKFVQSVKFTGAADE
jgi:hypothetical protein